MKRVSVMRRALVVLAAISCLCCSGGYADPTPAPHKKKHPVAKADADSSDATPPPRSSSKRSKRHQAHHTGENDGNDDQSVATASPAAHPDAGFHQPADPPASDGDKEDKTTPAKGKSDSGDSPAQTSVSSKPDAGPSAGPASLPVATSTIEAGELRDFDSQPDPVRNLLRSALELTHRNLTYTYGSSDPANGGMDCSGTIYFLLKGAGFEDVPRSASEQYSWVRQQSRFYAVLSKKEDTFELREMRPGDLLFWTGTYHVDHDPPVTHTMIYLGRRKKDGKPIMMGASDGRPYDGQKRNGVSVFDFKMPAARSADSADATTAAAPDHAPDFVGYGPIPGMAERNDAANRQSGALNKETKGSSAKSP